MPIETIDRLEAQLESESSRVSAEVDNILLSLLSSPGDGRDRLFEAMRHTAVGWGKRLLPLLKFAAFRVFAMDR